MALALELLPDAQMRHSDDRVRRLFEKRKCAVEINHTEIDGRPMRSLIVAGTDVNAWIAFIHGAPGSAMDYFPYLVNDRLRKRFNMISIDRPGYGYSQLGRAVTSIGVQAETIASLLRQQTVAEKLQLVAHSYGGPIAARIAMDHPDLVSSLCLLAPALDPDQERNVGIARLACSRVVSGLLPKPWRVAAREKTTHAAELRGMAQRWSDIRAEIIHIHGTNDWIVPYENIHYAGKKLGTEQVRSISISAGHLLLWTHSAMIARVIGDMSAAG